MLDSSPVLSLLSLSFPLLMLSVLQWNMKGYYNNLPDLQLLINNLSPSVISIQESHLPVPLIRLNNTTHIFTIPLKTMDRNKALET